MEKIKSKHLCNKMYLKKKTFKKDKLLIKNYNELR